MLFVVVCIIFCFFYLKEDGISFILERWLALSGLFLHRESFHRSMLTMPLLGLLQKAVTSAANREGGGTLKRALKLGADQRV